MKKLLFVLIILLLASTAYAGRIFEDYSTWYTPINGSLTLDPKSAVYKQYLLDHASYFATEYREWSIPVYYADADTPLRTVTNESGSYSWQVPIEDGWRAAGEDDICAGSTRDGNMVIIDQARDRVWEFRRMRKCSGGVPIDGDGWTCHLGRWDYLSGDGIYWCNTSPYYTGNGNCAIRVSGTHLLHGLILYDDIVTNKVINHAIGLAGPQTRPYAYGCRPQYPSPEHTAWCCGYQCGADVGYNANTDVPQMGNRFRLSSSYDCTVYTANSMKRLMCDALKTYGAIYVIHSGGAAAFFGEDLEWSTTRSWSGVVQSPEWDWLNYIEWVLPVCTGEECTKLGAVCSGGGQTYNCVSGTGDTENPTTPGSPSATAHASLQQITLSWSASTDNVGVAGYNIYACLGAACSPVYLAQTTSTSYVHSGLTASTLYRYQIEAFDTSNNKSTKTSVVSDTTPVQASATYTMLTRGQAITLDGNGLEFGYANVLTLNGNSIKFYWDDTYFYFYAYITDTEINALYTERDNPVNNDDSIAIMLSTTHNQTTSQISGDFKFYVSALGTIRDAQAGSSTWNASAFQVVATIDGTVNNNADSDTGWAVEARIPWTDLGVSAPSNLDVWGLEVELNDKDAATLTPYAWANLDGGGYNEPVGWGDVTYSTSTGDPAYPVTVKRTVKPSGGNHTTIDSCADWFTSNYPDLTSSNIIGQCLVDDYGWSSADTTAITIAGITTDTTRRLEIVSVSEKIENTYSDQKYRNESTAGTTVSIGIGNVLIKGLQFYNKSSIANAEVIDVNTTASTGIYIEKNILRATDAAETGRALIRATASGASSSIYVRYNLMYGIGTGNAEVAITNADADINMYADNNTIADVYDVMTSSGGSGSGQEDYNCTEDNRIKEVSVESNYGTSTTILVEGDYTNQRQRGVVSCNFAALDDSATVTGATLYLYISGWGNGSPIGRTHYASRLTRTDWSESQSTWNIYKTGSSWTAAGGDYTDTDHAEAVMPASAGQWVTWSVTALAQYAKASTSEIAHFLIRDSDEIGTHLDGVNYRSSDSTNPEKPYLKISYSIPSGGGTIIFRNNLITNVTQSTYAGATGSNYNFTSANIDFTGANNQKQVTFSFINSTNKDFRLRSGDASGARYGGMDLDYVTDAVGQTLRNPTHPTTGSFEPVRRRLF